MRPLFTTSEIETLNEARAILVDVQERARQLSADTGHNGRAFALGRLAEAAERGEQGVFETLNTAHSHCNAAIQEEELHPFAPERLAAVEDGS